MREWLTVGRFPVGCDLRVRLPEWERHLPLHQLYPNLNTAFVLPPAWPEMYVDDQHRGADGDGKNVKRSSDPGGRKQGGDVRVTPAEAEETPAPRRGDGNSRTSSGPAPLAAGGSVGDARDSGASNRSVLFESRRLGHVGDVPGPQGRSRQGS